MPRHSGTGAVRVYQFESRFAPIAARVEHFDGYTLTDVTSSGNRLVSPLVHITAHWLGYAVALAVALVFVAAWFAVAHIPRRGWLAAFRVLGFIGVVVTGGFYLLLMLFLAPISPLIFAALALALGLSYASFRNRIRQSTSAEQCAAGASR